MKLLGSYGKHGTTVMLAFLHLWEKGEYIGFREIANAAGLSLETTHRYMRSLREQGFVDFEDGKAGTIRPLVEVVR